MQDTIHAELESRARASPDQPFLVCLDRTLSFAVVEQLAERFACGLRMRGIRRSDVVTLWLENGWRWVICYFGILKCGATVNPVNVLLTADEVRFILADCGARMLIAGAERLGTLGSVAGVTLLSDSPVRFSAETLEDLLTDTAATEGSEKSAASDLATIGYTSGTTGRPRGAALSHRSIVLNAAMTALMHGRSCGDVVVSALPLTHVYGNIVMNSAVACGMSLVLLPRFDEESVLSSIERHRATMFEGVPTMYVRLINFPRLGGFDLSSLRLCTVGGQTMPPSQMEEVQRLLGCPLRELWGMTELGGLGTTHPHNGPPKLGSIGVALPTMETAVVDPSDAARPVARGEPGELMVRGPLMMRGYLGDERATSESITVDGWLHTGDIVRQDADGYFFVVDRKKEVIVSGGYKVYPAEVERVIAQYPAVEMVAVAPVKDELKGHVPRAFVVLKAGCNATEVEIISHCRTSLASYKIPKSVEFVTDLPRTSTGKILRRALANILLMAMLLFWQAPHAGAETAIWDRQGFSLIDTHGHPVHGADFRGRWLVVYFGFTRCPDVCPGSLLLISQALRLLGPLGADLTPVFITIDPANDTPAVIGKYLQHFDGRIVGLSGSKEQAEAAQRSFGVYSRNDGELPAHSSMFYVINPEGNLERQLSSSMTADEVARFLRKSLSGTHGGTAHD